MKKQRIDNMTDEELDAAYNREYKRTWLKWRKAKRVQAWLTLIVAIPILLILLYFLFGIIIAMFMA